MPAIQLLALPGSLPSTSTLKGVDISSTLKNPFYVMLRLDQFHLAPQNVAPVPSGVTHAWWTAYTKKSTSEKLKAVKALLVLNVSVMPNLNEEDESVTDSRAAVSGLQSSLDIQTRADEDEDDPPSSFVMAQPQPRSTHSGKTPKNNKRSSPPQEPEPDDSSYTDLSGSVDMNDNLPPKKKAKPMVQTTLKDQLRTEAARTKSTGSTSSSSSPTTAKRTKSTLNVSPPDDDEALITPKNKKRRKGEPTMSVSMVAAPIKDEDVSEVAIRSKEWKKMHYVGKHDIDPDAIRDPAVVWRARTVDPEHVQALKLSFQTHQKMNSKGLRLVLQNDSMWAKFNAMDDDEKEEVRELNNQFFQDLSGFMNWQPFTGDHTRTAASLLKAAYPLNPKWQMFRGVKFYLAADDEECDDMLRNLGNVNNTVAGLQRKLAFVDKIRQLHTYYEQHGLLHGSGKKRKEEGGRNTTQMMEELAVSWGMKTASMGQLVSLAKHTGKAWTNLDIILDGKYKDALTKKPAGPPTSISHFLHLGNIPPEAVANLFAQIIEAKLPIKKLCEACIRWKATHSLQMYILATAQAARPFKDFSTWEKLSKIIPALCHQKFIDGWVTAIKVKHDKFEPPPALKEAIIAQCEEKRVLEVRREDGPGS